jgi:hypothetical protein
MVQMYTAYFISSILERYSSYWQFTDRYWEIQDNGWGKDIANAKKAREKELLSLMEINSTT